MSTNKKDEQEDLVGFEDYLESLGNGVSEKSDKISNKATQTENLSLLMHDSERLRKLSNLLGTRLPQYQKYPQSDQLIQSEMHNLNIIKADLIEILKKDQSVLHQSLGIIINNFFKK